MIRMYSLFVYFIFLFLPLFLSFILLFYMCRQNLGGRLKVMVSGGSALPLHIESFFDMAGLRVSAVPSMCVLAVNIRLEEIIVFVIVFFFQYFESLSRI